MERMERVKDAGWKGCRLEFPMERMERVKRMERMERMEDGKHGKDGKDEG